VALVFSELLTFSDCRQPGRQCGYGEYSKPKTSNDRNTLLTALATSLLCEQNVAEEYVCGPLLFLADVANRLNISTVVDRWDLGFGTHLNLVRIDFVIIMESRKWHFRRGKLIRFSSCKHS
jgi:hypothetical protein